MKTIRFEIGYGGFYGATEEYTVEVDDNATQEEIEQAVDEKYEELIHDNCSLEIFGEDEEDEDDD